MGFKNGNYRDLAAINESHLKDVAQKQPNKGNGKGKANHKVDGQTQQGDNEKFILNGDEAKGEISRYQPDILLVDFAAYFMGALKSREIKFSDNAKHLAMLNEDSDGVKLSALENAITKLEQERFGDDNEEKVFGEENDEDTVLGALTEVVETALNNVAKSLSSCKIYQLQRRPTVVLVLDGGKHACKKGADIMIAKKFKECLTQENEANKQNDDALGAALLEEADAALDVGPGAAAKPKRPKPAWGSAVLFNSDRHRAILLRAVTMFARQKQELNAICVPGMSDADLDIAAFARRSHETSTKVAALGSDVDLLIAGVELVIDAQGTQKGPTVRVFKRSAILNSLQYLFNKDLEIELENQRLQLLTECSFKPTAEDLFALVMTLWGSDFSQGIPKLGPKNSVRAIAKAAIALHNSHEMAPTNQDNINLALISQIYEIHKPKCEKSSLISGFRAFTSSDVIAFSLHQASDSTQVVDLNSSAISKIRVNEVGAPQHGEDSESVQLPADERQKRFDIFVAHVSKNNEQWAAAFQDRFNESSARSSLGQSRLSTMIKKKKNTARNVFQGTWQVVDSLLFAVCQRKLLGFELEFLQGTTTAKLWFEPLKMLHGPCSVVKNLSLPTPHEDACYNARNELEKLAQDSADKVGLIKEGAVFKAWVLVRIEPATPNTTQRQKAERNKEAAEKAHATQRTLDNRVQMTIGELAVSPVLKRNRDVGESRQELHRILTLFLYRVEFAKNFFARDAMVFWSPSEDDFGVREHHEEDDLTASKAQSGRAGTGLHKFSTIVAREIVASYFLRTDPFSVRGQLFGNLRSNNAINMNYNFVTSLCDLGYVDERYIQDIFSNATNLYQKRLMDLVRSNVLNTCEEHNLVENANNFADTMPEYAFDTLCLFILARYTCFSESYALVNLLHSTLIFKLMCRSDMTGAVSKPNPSITPEHLYCQDNPEALTHGRLKIMTAQSKNAESIVGNKIREINADLRKPQRCVLLGLALGLVEMARKGKQLLFTEPLASIESRYRDKNLSVVRTTNCKDCRGYAESMYKVAASPVPLADSFESHLSLSPEAAESAIVQALIKGKVGVAPNAGHVPSPLTASDCVDYEHVQFKSKEARDEVIRSLERNIAPLKRYSPYAVRKLAAKIVNDQAHINLRHIIAFGAWGSKKSTVGSRGEAGRISYSGEGDQVTAYVPESCDAGLALVRDALSGDSDELGGEHLRRTKSGGKRSLWAVLYDTSTKHGDTVEGVLQLFGKDRFGLGSSLSKIPQNTLTTLALVLFFARAVLPELIVQHAQVWQNPVFHTPQAKEWAAFLKHAHEICTNDPVCGSADTFAHIEWLPTRNNPLRLDPSGGEAEIVKHCRTLQNEVERLNNVVRQLREERNLERSIIPTVPGSHSDGNPSPTMQNSVPTVPYFNMATSTDCTAFSLHRVVYHKTAHCIRGTEFRFPNGTPDPAVFSAVFVNLQSGCGSAKSATAATRDCSESYEVVVSNLCESFGMVKGAKGERNGRWDFPPKQPLTACEYEAIKRFVTQIDVKCLAVPPAGYSRGQNDEVTRVNTNSENTDLAKLKLFYRGIEVSTRAGVMNLLPLRLCEAPPPVGVGLSLRLAARRASQGASIHKTTEVNSEEGFISIHAFYKRLDRWFNEGIIKTAIFKAAEIAENVHEPGSRAADQDWNNYVRNVREFMINRLGYIPVAETQRSPKKKCRAGKKGTNQSSCKRKKL